MRLTQDKPGYAMVTTTKSQRLKEYSLTYDICISMATFYDIFSIYPASVCTPYVFILGTRAIFELHVETASEETPAHRSSLID